MIYKIVSPFEYEIEGDTYTTAIKDFIKLNHDLRINQMIFKDQQKYMMANMNYYRQNQKNKIGIDTYPLNYIPIINNNMPNMLIKIKSQKSEDKKTDDTKTDDTKTEEKRELSHKLVVPTPLPNMFPYSNTRMPLVPVVYNVYKNNETTSDDNTKKIKFVMPMMYPYSNPYIRGP